MGKHVVKQYRFYGDNNANNFPNNISEENLMNGTIFNTANGSIRALRIQAMPGTSFTINGGEHPAIIGLSGSFFISESMGIIIESLKFNNLMLLNGSGFYGIIIDTVEVLDD